MNELQAPQNPRENASSADESVSAPRPAWRLAVAGTLAVGLLGAATIARCGAEPASPVAFLEHAAAAVDTQESGQPERPRDDQWIYQKTRWDITSSMAVRPALIPENSGPDREEWIRFVGRRLWTVEDGKPTEVPLKPQVQLEGNPAEIWDQWQTLPRDPRALLDAIYQQVAETKSWLDPDWWVPQAEVVVSGPHERDQEAVNAISRLLAKGRGLTQPKDLQASLYRALALIPDIEVSKGVKDVAGREAIAVTLTTSSPVTILLDPVSYAYLGWGTEIEDRKFRGGVALLEAKVVDKPGER